MNRSEQIGELVAALAKAQSEFTPALKDSDNPYYGSKYADLASVISAVRPAFSKNGIFMTHNLESDLERQVAIVTVGLYHGEQFMEVTVEAPATGKGKDGQPKFDVQTIGAAWSYLRRYTLQAICGLASEDDDGNSLQNDNKPIAKRNSSPTTQQTHHATPPPAQQGKFLLTDDMLFCVIEGVTTKETKANMPYLSVVFNGRVDGFNYAFCYDTKYFEILRGAVKKEVNVRLRPTRSDDKKSIRYFTIEDVLFIDGVEYENGMPVGKENLDAEPVADIA